MRVVIADDHRLMLDGIRRALEADGGFEIVGDTQNGTQVMPLVSSTMPDLVLLDVRMPGIGGVEAARRILGAAPRTAVVMMTMAEDVDGVARAVSSGARGYLVKDASREELTTMVTQALADVTAPHTTRPRLEGDGLPSLTERELQVLRGMGRGRSNSEIGRELYLSEDTVKTHARRLFRKLGVRDRAQAVAHGFRRGLVS